MNREEALHIFQHSEEIVSAGEVNGSIGRMAEEIRGQIGEEFPLVLSVMGGAAVFTGMLLPHLDFPLEFDYIHLTRYRNTTKGSPEMHWRVAPRESVKDRIVLVLDDILDEGETMAAIRDRILEMGGEALPVRRAVRKDAGEGEAAASGFLRVRGARPLRVRLRDGREGVLAQPADDPRPDGRRLTTPRAAAPATSRTQQESGSRIMREPLFFIRRLLADWAPDGGAQRRPATLAAGHNW
ncbi:phosphoribosyl transferase domain protein [Burkholderia thailandensis 2002721643]|nr:phosphoribosyl transferase domain protein [Burkholderia thailandensis 2002721643]